MNLETAGARLKKIRQERGLSLEDIQKKTKIHFNVLRAIEGDSISDLSPVYLKSFIKIYCNYLGLDPKEFIGETSQQHKPVLNAVIGRDIGERVEKKPASSFIKDASLKLGAMRPAPVFKKIIIFTVSVLILIFLVFNLVRFISSRFKRQPAGHQVFVPAAAAPKSIKAKPARTIKK
ncbi:helix-turn-helix domain-containing protein, partial [bacterium]